MAVKKSFLFDEEIATKLKELAKKKGITQVQVVRNLIEKKYKDIATPKREL